MNQENNSIHTLYCIFPTSMSVCCLWQCNNDLSILKVCFCFQIFLYGFWTFPSPYFFRILKFRRCLTNIQTNNISTSETFLTPEKHFFSRKTTLVVIKGANHGKLCWGVCSTPWKPFTHTLSVIWAHVPAVINKPSVQTPLFKRKNSLGRHLSKFIPP